jgi:hypothetical protein
MTFANRLLLVGCAALFSFAAAAGYEPWLKGPCAEDAKRLCGDVMTAGGDILGCMRSHEKELSSGCTLKREERRAEATAAVGDLKKECAADIEKFCRKPVAPKPGESRTGPHGCLKDNYPSLSPGCKAHYDAMNLRRDRLRPKPVPKVKSTPATPPETTSIERESADLAAALASDRALSIGEPLSPAERVLVLALAATGHGAKD